ncbi:MAG: response regulator transcription factor [Leptospiraceae bacterium]|nr:response regulator transcription factor [Leptospiraceae bacterium]
MSENYRIVLCDDHSVVREGLRNMIESEGGLKVVAECSNGVELLEYLRAEGADLVILDLSMPRFSGLELLDVLKPEFKNLKVLVLTMHKDRDYFQKAMNAGVDGYILKDDAFDDLMGAISSIRFGEKAYSADLQDRLDESAPESPEDPSLDILTRREAQILRMIASGKMNRDIGEVLGISVRTVEFHRANLMEKLRFRNATELVRFAVSRGIV